MSNKIRSQTVVTKVIYRSILRACKPFISSSKTLKQDDIIRKESKPIYDVSSILSSLLYRNGIDDSVDYTKLYSKHNENNQVSQSEKKTSDLNINMDDVSNLTNSIDVDSITESHIIKRTKPHVGLYKMILKELLDENSMRDSSDNSTNISEFNENYVHLNFPSRARQLVSNRLLDIVRREFRASKEDIIAPISQHFNPGEIKVNINKIKNDIAFSSHYEYSIRVDAALLGLRELEKKISWAKSLGLHIGKHTEKKSSSTEYQDILNDVDLLKKQAAKDVYPLSTNNPSSYLRPGNYLVAHPLLTGCFARSVICILEHTPSSTPSTKQSEDDSSSRIVEEDDKKESISSSLSTTSKTGGTYGLIVNKEITVSSSTSDHSKTNKKRNRTLQEILRHDALPESVRKAFGLNFVRDGGPVNFSLQMLRSMNTNDEAKLRIGGNMLPMISSNEDDGTENSVYFGGDVILAAHSVISGDVSPDKFTFFAGASCWEPGQLENEIARGYWLPCRGPSSIALRGVCDHLYTTTENISDHDQPDTSQNQKKIADDPSDTYLSMMCALGIEEGKLASILRYNEDLYDENGEPCDKCN